MKFVIYITSSLHHYSRRQAQYKEQEWQSMTTLENVSKRHVISIICTTGTQVQPVLEIAAGHWPLAIFQSILAFGQPKSIFTVHFQWDSNQKSTKCLIFNKMADQFLTLISNTDYNFLFIPYHPLSFTVQQ